MKRLYERRRSFPALEQLEQRLLLAAAPVANPDEYFLDEDTILSGDVSLFTADFEAAAPVDVITTGDSWEYLDRIENSLGAGDDYPIDAQSRSWKQIDFDRSSSTVGPWNVNNTPLEGGSINGFTSSQNVLFGLDAAPTGENLINTYLFRKTFELSAGQAATTSATVRTLCDDGCIGYVNGTEVFRLNMDPGSFNPAGLLTTETLTGVGNEDSYSDIQIDLSAANLVSGTNVLTVEVHQQSLTSSDVGFDLEMTLGGSSVDGFVYGDDLFGTAQPAFAEGTFDAAGGFTGGGLSVLLGPGRVPNPPATSGGWSRDFILDRATTITVSTRFRMLLGNGYESDEFGEAVLTVDGTRYGNSVNNSLVHQNGDGNGGANPDDTGWLSEVFSIPLPAGVHTLTVGAFNNKATATNEFTQVFFDDVSIAQQSGVRSVLDNDDDVDGDQLTAAIISSPANGSISFQSDGTFTYTPNANFFGDDTFSYLANDGGLNSNIAVVTIHVASVNDVPDAVNDGYTAFTDVSLEVSVAGGVLSNDSDPDGQAISAILVSGTSSGNLILQANGSFTYTANANFVGIDTFIYRADDGVTLSPAATVTINVLAANQAPTANDDLYSVGENETLTILLPDAGSIQVFATDFGSGVPAEFSGPIIREGVQGFDGVGSGGNQFAGQLLRNMSGGNPAGATTLTLTDLPNHSSISLNFLLAIIDSWEGNTGDGAPDTLTVTIDGAAIFSETFDTGNSFDQSYSPPGSGLLIDGENLGFSLGGAGEQGQFVDSAYDMSAEPAFHDIVHSASTLTISWFASGAGWEGGVNESWALDNVEVVLNRNDTGELIAAGSDWRFLDNGVDQGTAWIEPGFNDSSWPFNPAQLGYGDGDEATTLDFGPDSGDKIPTYYFRHHFNVDNASLIGGLVLGLLRDDGAAVYLNGVEVARDNLVAGAIFDDFADTPISGSQESEFFDFDVDPSLLVDGDNVLAVEIHQANGGSSDISFDLRLTSVGLLGVLANDSDPEGGPLTARLVSGPLNGALQLNPSGTFTYTPNVNFDGTDTFTYVADDGTKTGNTAVVTITVVPAPNAQPVAADDLNYTVKEDGILVIDGIGMPGVLENDSDDDQDPLQAVLKTNPTRGSVTLNSDGTFTYTPQPDFFGSDSFQYAAWDGNDESVPATVVINVTPVDDDPAAISDQYFVEGDSQLIVGTATGLLANDEDPDGEGLEVLLISGTTKGNLQLAANGSFIYTPSAGAEGQDSFSYRVRELTSGEVSPAATVIITIDFRPIAVDDPNYQTSEDVSLIVSAATGVLVNDFDPESDPMTASLLQSPARGTVSLALDGSFIYTPALNFFGIDSFTYQVSDGDQLSDAATVMVNVLSVNDAPVAENDRFELFEGELLSVNTATGLLVNDSDIDSSSLSAQLMSDVGSGQLTLAADGSFSYQPNPAFVGVDTFTYRTSDGDLTSPEVSVSLVVNPSSQRIVINEIMYHPSSELTTQEYIELFNASDATVELQGWQFTNGISFVFPNVSIPAGGYLVVVPDLVAFATKYPGVTNVVGSWTGQLSNRGEKIELEDLLGNRVDRVTYSDNGDWGNRRRGPDSAGSEGWIWTANHDGLGSSLELINPQLTNRIGQNWAASPIGGETPGAANTVADDDIAPLIRDVAHGPVVPTSGDSVTVTAKLTDELDVGISGTVFYRVADNNPGGFISATMFDDGLHGDGQAGDGVFGAVLPPQESGTVIEFYVRSEDVSGDRRTWPAPTDDAGGQGANLLYQVDDSPTISSQPIYKLIMTPIEQAEFGSINRNSNAQMNATFIAISGYGTDVRYNTGVRVRGASSRFRDPVGMRVNIPHDRSWNGQTQLNLNTQYTWLQLTGSALFQLAGLAAAEATAVQVEINGGNAARVGSPQFGSYVHLQPLGSEFVDDNFPLDDGGNLYKKRRPDRKWRYRDGDVGAYVGDGWSKGTNESDNDWSDLDNFLFVMNNASGDSYLSEVGQVADIDQWVRWFAMMTLLTDRETNLSNGTDDDYSMYRGVNDPRFVLVPHDLDTIFGQGDTPTNPDASIFPMVDSGFAGQSMPQLVSFMQHPEIASRYYAQLTELIETVFSAQQLNPLLDNLLSDFVPQNVIQEMKDFAAARRTFVLSQIPSELSVSTNLSIQDGFLRTTDPASVVFSGTAPSIDTRHVLVNGVEMNWSSFDGTWLKGNLNSDILLPSGSDWSFLDDGSDLGTNWIEPGFDDSLWSREATQLGYGDGDESFEIGFGDNPNQKFITTYFRTAFEIADASQFSAITLRLLRDDGAAVYLNGTEITRDNLDPGALFDDLANGTVGGGEESTFFEFSVSPSLLNNGTNTLAVEIHQASLSSSDISFDLEMLGSSINADGGIPLSPGINRVLIQTLDTNDQELERQTVDVWYDDGSQHNVSGTIAASTTWTAVGGPYRVTGDIIIPDGVTLTIEPGTNVYFDAGTGFTVNGRLLAEGTATSHIRLSREPGATNAWDGIAFVNSLNDSRMAFVDMMFGDDQGESILVDRSQLLIDNMSWSNVTRTVIEVNHPSLIVQNSHFPDSTEEVIHGEQITGNEYFVLDGNLFDFNTSGQDVVDFLGAARPGPVFQVLNNVFLGGGDDGIDLDGTDTHVEGNLFANFHLNTNRNTTSNAIATGLPQNGDPNRTELTVVRNIFVDNDHAILLKEDAFLTAENNVFVNSSEAAIQFNEIGGTAVNGPGLGAMLDGNIFAGNAALFKNLVDANGFTTTLNLHRSIVPSEIVDFDGTLIGAVDLGEGNIVEDPRFIDAAGGDFGLLPGSPALRSGPNGLDIGSAVPGGASVSGAPAPISRQEGASLTVAGPGITHYRYRLNGGPLFAERSISDPLTLSGLSDGDQTLSIIGKNSAGVWQNENDALLVSWTVNTSLPQIRINEILAVNVTAFNHEGTFPDVVELYNSGPSLDLSGMRISDNLDLPDKFAFPENTILGVGEYLVLFANSPDGTSGIHLGFALSGSGEGVFLLPPTALGDSPIDAIEFGPQIVDRSIGRVADDSWRLNQPTPGGENLVERTGDIYGLKINEWLASKDLLFSNDLIEIYNPDPLPVDMGGLFISDNPVGLPQKHQIAPLSFVDGGGFGVLIADGDPQDGPDHVDFRLAPEGELIALYDGAENQIDIVLYGPQQAGASQGRNPDGGPLFATYPLSNIGFSNSVTLSAIELLENLRITELMYHPSDTGAFEFVEVQNIGDVPIDLIGVRFTNGINFTFPDIQLGPGEYGVIVENFIDFESRYGDQINVLGQYSGRLSNGGENVELTLPLPFDAKILDFTFRDEWYPITDGGGPSLVIIDPDASIETWGQASSWRASGSLIGSPGSADPIDGTPPQIVKVVLGGSSWSPEFVAGLNSLGLGNGGFLIPIDGSPTPLLPWLGIDLITIEFSEPVVLSADPIVIAGTAIAQYNLAAGAPVVDGNRVTWLIDGPISADRIQVIVNQSVTDLFGNALDGDNDNLPGGNFQTGFDVLPGDVNRDGDTETLDLRSSLSHQFRRAGDPGYDVFHDVDANGAVNFIDLIHTRNGRSSLLPVASPATSPLAANSPGATFGLAVPLNIDESATPHIHEETTVLQSHLDHNTRLRKATIDHVHTTGVDTDRALFSETLLSRIRARRRPLRVDQYPYKEITIFGE